nr:hypothetical protein [Bacillaceae bacterium]
MPAPLDLQFLGSVKQMAKHELDASPFTFAFFVSCKADGLGLKIPLAKNPDANGMFFRFSVAAGYQNPPSWKNLPLPTAAGSAIRKGGIFFAKPPCLCKILLPVSETQPSGNGTAFASHSFYTNYWTLSFWDQKDEKSENGCRLLGFAENRVFSRIHECGRNPLAMAISGKPPVLPQHYPAQPRPGLFSDAGGRQDLNPKPFEKTGK